MKYFNDDSVKNCFLGLIEKQGTRIEEHTYYGDGVITTVFRYRIYNEEYLIIKQNGECLIIINTKELSKDERLKERYRNVFYQDI